ncbi:MAG: hypothetical protein OEW00_12220 [candidate division Zixibacteria bacterium]|nr:hypothetical protein [candidate division Zixibacteria bacterium]
MNKSRRFKANSVVALAAVVILWAGATTLEAADYWVDGDLGWSSIGVTGGVGFSSVAHSRIFSIRTLFDMWEREPGWSLMDLGVLYGLASREDNGAIVAISAGIGLTRATPKKEKSQSWPSTSPAGSDEPVSTVGLLLQLQIFGRSGLGLKAFGNVNPEQSFGGLLLCLRFGKYR